MRVLILQIVFFISILFTSGVCHSQTLYDENFRPQFHFTPAKNWINDPCGTVYYDGLYHLMYQYNPFGDQWGNMSWGHAVSTDLVHWVERSVALAPDANGDIFSGGAIVDVNNTAGFGANALIAIFTHAGPQGQSQSLAYSLDNGTTWIKYQNNPVLRSPDKPDYRDPQVFWHAPTSNWVMTLAVGDRIQILGSKNLKNWTLFSEFGATIGAHGGVWECPDLFPLKVEGTDITKWVMMVSINPGGPAGGSGTQYFVGEFDGVAFTPDEEFSVTEEVQLPPGVVFADFEGPDYSGWTVTGDAFGSAPAKGTLADQQVVKGYLGTQLVNSFRNGDNTQGTLVSSEFVIVSPYINFLIGGGNHPGLTEIRLVVNDVIVRRTTGKNEEQLRWNGWDVKEFSGKSARIEIVDAVSGGWGHVNVDHIMFSDQAVSPAVPVGYWVDYGPDFYAARSWENLPDESGTRTWIGWMSNWSYAGSVPTAPFRGAMSLPRKLTLKAYKEGIRLNQKPIEAISELADASKTFAALSLPDANTFIRNNDVKSDQFELDIVLYPGSGTDAGVKIRSNNVGATLIGYNREKNVVYIDRSKSGLMPYGDSFSRVFETSPITRGDSVHLHILVDKSSVEVFVNDGERVLTALVFPFNTMEGIQFFETGTGTVIKNFRFATMRSIWSDLVTGINLPKESVQINVYPNPSSGRWTISTANRVTRAKIYSLAGGSRDLNLNRVNESTIELSSDGLPNGMYFLKLYDGSYLLKTMKLIIDQ